MTKTKTYPSRVVEDAARETGVNVQYLWEMKGPKDTRIAWISALMINGRVAIVQTFDDGGWEVYTPSGSINTTTTIVDALTRCGVTLLKV